MREIKFRAWNKENKSMINFDFALSPTGSLLKYQDRNGCYGETHSKEEIELMQYTGLKDKNGKEIYEGDIVTKKYSDHTVTLKIEWNDYGGFSELYCNNEIEIIGNIYENSGLLQANETHAQ